jgi:hypothetical protein
MLGIISRLDFELSIRALASAEVRTSILDPYCYESRTSFHDQVFKDRGAFRLTSRRAGALSAASALVSSPQRGAESTAFLSAVKRLFSTASLFTDPSFDELFFVNRGRVCLSRDELAVKRFFGAAFRVARGPCPSKGGGLYAGLRPRSTIFVTIFHSPLFCGVFCGSG